MTKITVYNAHQAPVLLDAQPLGQGGEGIVYRAKSRYLKGNYVAKIYHPQELTPQREIKVKYLIENTPEFAGANSAIFPEEPLYDKDQKFVGFLMKQTVNQVDITSLCSLKPSAKLDKSWHYKYHRYSKLGTHSRIRVCYNIAQAFHQLHQTKQFVFVDIKPENIKLTYEGEVSLIDVDSIQIAKGTEQALAFAAQKVTHEYSPAEIRQINFKNEYVPEHWDRFSLAVVFYKILFGLHPYTGSTLPPYDQLVTNEQKIANGLFVHGHKKRSFKVIPMPHHNFWLIPKRLQNLFMQAFDDGHTQPSARPSMKEWMDVLDSVPEFELEPIHTPADWQAARKIADKNHSEIRTLAKTQTRWQRLRKRLTEDVLVFSMVSVMALFGAGTLYGIANGVFSSLDTTVLSRPRVGAFNDGLAWKEIDKDRFIYINRWNQKAFRGTFEEAHDFFNGLAKVKKNGKFGLINLQGRTIIPFQYDLMLRNIRAEGIKAIQVKVNGKFGLISHEGEEILPFEYEQMWYNPRTGVVELAKDGRFGLYDHEGVELAPLRFKSRAQMLKETKDLLKIYYSIK